VMGAGPFGAPVEGGHEAVAGGLEGGEQQFGLAPGEVAVERRPRQADRGADGVHAGPVHALGAEEPHRGGEDLVTAAHRPTAEAAAPAAGAPPRGSRPAATRRSPSWRAPRRVRTVMGRPPRPYRAPPSSPPSSAARSGGARRSRTRRPWSRR